MLAARLSDHIQSLQRSIDAIVKEARRPVRTDLAAAGDATAAVRARAAYWSALAEDQGRTMTVSLPDHPLVVPVAADDLADVVDVLVDNVFAHTPDGTAFEIGLEHVDGAVVLVVADDGPGIAIDRPRRPGGQHRAGPRHRPSYRGGVWRRAAGRAPRPARGPGWRSGCRWSGLDGHALSRPRAHRARSSSSPLVRRSRRRGRSSLVVVAVVVGSVLGLAACDGRGRRLAPALGCRLRCRAGAGGGRGGEGPARVGRRDDDRADLLGDAHLAAEHGRLPQGAQRTFGRWRWARVAAGVAGAASGRLGAARRAAVRRGPEAAW